jgi:hypothetical protein
VSALPTPLDVRRLHIRLDFAEPERDAIRVAGRLPLADGFVLDGKLLVLDVGGVTRVFRLERRGRGARGSIAGVAARLVIGRPRENRAKFAAKLRKGEFGEVLGATSGLDDADVAAERRTVRVTLLLPPVVLQADEPQVYTARQGRRGRTQ